MSFGRAIVAFVVLAIIGFTAYVLVDEPWNSNSTQAVAETSNVSANGTNGNSGNTASGSNSNNATAGNNTVTCTDHPMQPGEYYQAQAGCNIKGDVQVGSSKNSLTAYYDSDPSTGLIVSCTETCWVYAQWGANVSPRSVDDLKSEEMKSGCDNNAGCKSVTVVTWPQSNSGKSGGSQVTTSATPVVCDPSIPKGQWMLVPSGCVISGDVAVSSSQGGTPTILYDSDQTTGLVVTVGSGDPVWVFAPYGASVTGANPVDVVNAVKATGCGLPTGCATVTLKTVTNHGGNLNVN